MRISCRMYALGTDCAPPDEPEPDGDDFERSGLNAFWTHEVRVYAVRLNPLKVWS
jgi:hypothetical protein